jgi:hypothetical protein
MSARGNQVFGPGGENEVSGGGDGLREETHVLPPRGNDVPTMCSDTRYVVIDQVPAV